MCEYMEYTINARVCFCGTHQGWYKRLLNFSEHGCITFSTIATSEEEAFQVLVDKINEQCDKMMRRGEFHFCFADAFYGDGDWVTIPKLRTVSGSVVEFTITVDDPRKWTIQKVIEKCSVAEAISIFGEQIGWLIGLIKTGRDEE